MVKINGVVIPTQLALALLNQLRHYVTNRNAESIAGHDEGDRRWFAFDFDWFKDFLNDLGIPQTTAFIELPIWWPESNAYICNGVSRIFDLRSGYRWESATITARRLQFIDMLIHEVMQEEING